MNRTTPAPTAAFRVIEQMYARDVQVNNHTCYCYFGIGGSTPQRTLRLCQVNLGELPQHRVVLGSY